MHIFISICILNFHLCISIIISIIIFCIIIFVICIIALIHELRLCTKFLPIHIPRIIHLRSCIFTQILNRSLKPIIFLIGINRQFTHRIPIPPHPHPRPFILIITTIRLILYQFYIHIIFNNTFLFYINTIIFLSIITIIIIIFFFFLMFQLW